MHKEEIMLAFLTSMVVAIYSIQRIIRFADSKRLYDEPDERKIHTRKISNLGGIGVFMASMFTYFAFSNMRIFPRPDTLFSVSILLFFVGLKDDIDPVKPLRRLAYETICAAFIIYFTDVRIPSLFGVFGVYDLPYWVSCGLTVIFFLGCINAYNMIDGVDGLLGSLSVVGVVLFGLMFLSSGEFLWAVLCASLAGALIAFLIYNWNPALIFMGNGGSMFLGTVFACLALRFMQLGVIDLTFFSRNLHLKILMPHTIALAVIAVPIFDMLSVFIIRICNRQSPFSADKRHTHHRLLDIGLSQRKTVLTLVAANVAIIAFAYFVQDTGALRSLLYTILFCSFLQVLLLFIHWRWFARTQRCVSKKNCEQEK